MNSSEEIKSRLDIVDVLREYIQLRPAGVNFRALCPFHREKSPSFVVSPEKQIWHCFGCGKGGDVLTFVMEMEGSSFIETLRALAPRAGVQLKREDPKLFSQKNRLLDILDISKKYYHDIFSRDVSAESARKYLTERGLKKEIIEEWSIGFSPDSWDDLSNFLQGKGYKENEIFLAGMSVKSDKGSGFYNRFRGRIMFPINDINGNTVGFSARVSPDKEKEEKMGKYINSPQTIVYDKSKVIFGLDKAKQEIKKQDMAILVEGQMDVITAHQNGFKNVIASSGTALTIHQAGLLKRYSQNIALAFDMDEAGKAAAERATEITLRADINTKIVKTPKGKDPDECIREEPGEWRKAVSDAIPAVEHFFEQKLSKLDLDNIKDKRTAIKEILPMLANIGNKIECDFWIGRLSQRIGAKEELVREEFLKMSGKKENETENNKKINDAKEAVSREELISEVLLALIIRFPQFIEYAANNVQPDILDGGLNKPLYNGLIIYYNNIIDSWTHEGGSNSYPQLNYNEFRSWLSEESPLLIGINRENGADFNNRLLNLFDKLVILGDKDFFELEEGAAQNELIKASLALKKSYLLSRMREVEVLLEQAEKEKNDGVLSGLMSEFKILTEELRELLN